MSDTDRLLDAIGRVLIRSLLIAWGVLLVWFVVFLMAGDWIHSLHGQWFEMTRREMDLIFYAGMGLFKLGALLLFLIPWIAIRLVRRG